MKLIAGAKSGKLRAIDQKSSALASIIAADKKKKYEEEQARIKQERMAMIEAQAKATADEAKRLGSKTGLAIETAKGVGSTLLNFAKDVARVPLTVPMKVTQSLVEGVTDTPQVYTPETGVERFFYGDKVQSYQQDQESIRKFGEDKGLGKGASIALGAAGAAAESVTDLALPGIAKILSKTFIGRALSKLTGRTPKEISAVEVQETVDDVINTTGRNISPDEKTAVIDALSKGADKETIVKAVEKESITEQKKGEAIQQWMSNNKKFSDEQVEDLRKNPVGREALDYDEKGNITLYRKGAVEDGKPQSYSLVKKPGQEPVVVNKKEILVNFNSDEITDVVKKASDNPIQYDANINALSKFQELETEVIALKGKLESKVNLSGTSESKILKEVNKNLDEASQLDETLPTTTFKRQFSLAEKAINKDPAVAYNKALSSGGEEMTKSSLQLMLIRNAINKGDDKALSELGTAAARTGREAGQTSSMFRALYDKDPMSRILLNLARTKLASVESRFPRSLKKSLEEGTDIVQRTTKLVKSKSKVTFQDAQSIIDQFICK